MLVANAVCLLSYGFSLVCHLPFVISVSSSDDITFSTVLQRQYASELKQSFKGTCRDKGLKPEVWPLYLLKHPLLNFTNLKMIETSLV